MKKTILLLTLASTLTLTANPFTNTMANNPTIKTQASQKYFYAKRAALQGNAQAQYDLGLMYATGDGVEKNEALALTWFTRASENNFAKRVNVQRVVKPTVTSQKVIFAKRAAAKGNVQAQFDLGMMYLKGDGVRKNEQLAFTYFHKAARKNHVEAKFYMGLSFAEGKGVRKQTQLARYWFKLAAKAGHRTAMAHLSSLERKVRPQVRVNRRVAFNRVNFKF